MKGKSIITKIQSSSVLLDTFSVPLIWLYKYDKFGLLTLANSGRSKVLMKNTVRNPFLPLIYSIREMSC